MFRVIRPYHNLLAKPRFFQVLRGGGIILCILNSFRHSKCKELHFALLAGKGGGRTSDKSYDINFKAIAYSDFLGDFRKLPFPPHLGKYFIKLGKKSAKIHEIGKIKAIFGLGMTPIQGGKNGQIKSLAYQNALVCYQPNKFWNFNPQK